MKKRPRSDIGKEILRICRQNKITQKQLAESVEVDPIFLNGVINGRNTPSIGLLQKIADLYGRELIIKMPKKKGDKEKVSLKKKPAPTIEDETTF